jgi:hypothetical protein
MTDTLDTADRIAMLIGGGLLMLGIPVIGFITSFVAPHEITEGSSTGDVVIHQAIAQSTRAYIIALALLVFFLWAVCRLTAPRVTTST